MIRYFRLKKGGKSHAVIDDDLSAVCGFTFVEAGDIFGREHEPFERVTMLSCQKCVKKIRGELKR